MNIPWIYFEYAMNILMCVCVGDGNDGGAWPQAAGGPGQGYGR